MDTAANIAAAAPAAANAAAAAAVAVADVIAAVAGGGCGRWLPSSVTVCPPVAVKVKVNVGVMWL